MRVAVMGAGGIGGYVGGRLAEIGESVHFIARGRHLDALRANGLRIESPDGDAVLPAVHATDDPVAVGPVDLVLFTVKLGATEAAAQALAPLIGPRTRVVTLQNGIDGKAMIAKHVEKGRIAAGSIYVSAAISEPGVIRSPGGAHRIVVDRLFGDPVVEAFVASCGRAVALEAKATNAIEHVLWDKFVALVAFSGATCLTRSPIGPVLGHPESLSFLPSLLAENLAVAAAVGQQFGPNKAEDILTYFRGLPAGTKSSMLVDLQAGKSLEMPWLSGRVLGLARKHGIAAPANAAVIAALGPHTAGSGPDLGATPDPG